MPKISPCGSRNLVPRAFSFWEKPWERGCCSRSIKYVERGHFTSLFGRRRPTPRPQVSGYFWITKSLFPDSKISPPTRYRIRIGFIIFHSESRFKTVRIRGCVWTEAISGKKKLRIQKYPDTCEQGLRNACTRIPNACAELLLYLKLSNILTGTERAARDA